MKRHELVPILDKMVDEWVGRVYDWDGCDCSDLIAAYAPTDVKEGWPEYTDAKGAKAAIKTMGYRSYIHCLDEHFERTDYAAKKMGDLIGLKSTFNGMDCIGVLVGDGTRVLTFFPEWYDDGRPMVDMPWVCKVHPLDELETQELVTKRIWRVY
jgi:hypothetical protein